MKNTISEGAKSASVREDYERVYTSTQEFHQPALRRNIAKLETQRVS